MERCWIDRCFREFADGGDVLDAFAFFCDVGRGLGAGFLDEGRPLIKQNDQGEKEEDGNDAGAASCAFHEIKKTAGLSRPDGFFSILYQILVTHGADFFFAGLSSRLGSGGVGVQEAVEGHEAFDFLFAEDVFAVEAGHLFVFEFGL